MPFGLEREIINQEVYQRTLQHIGEAGIRLRRLSTLTDPRSDRDAMDKLRSVDPDTPDANNLLRVHWYNSDDRNECSSSKLSGQPSFS